jgi:hypothetical protein
MRLIRDALSSDACNGGVLLQGEDAASALSRVFVAGGELSRCLGGKRKQGMLVLRGGTCGYSG